MRDSELKVKLDEVSKRVKSLGLIPKCIRVVKVQDPDYSESVYKCHTHVSGSYKGHGIEIHYEDGLNEMGGGYLHVEYNKKTVLDADRSRSGERLLPETNGFFIESYSPGNWEKAVVRLSRLKKPEKKQVKTPIEDPHVNPELLKDYRRRFGIR
jgi:hypothetical protein